MTIDNKQIKKLAQEKIKLGVSKQAIYEELNQEFHGGLKIASIIQSQPSARALTKYKFLHILFLVLLSILILLLVLSQSFVGIIWTAPMIYFAATHKARYYGWACIAGLYGLFPGIQQLLVSAEGMETIRFIIVLLIGILFIAVSFTIAFLGFYLRSKLTPSFIEKKELYKDDVGNSRFRLVFEFKD